MKIIIDEGDQNNEVEIIIKCKKCDDEILSLLARLNAKEEKLIGILDKKSYVIEPNEVFYFESVDKKTFIYTKDHVYETSLRLYELEKLLRLKGFFRATKSSIVNITKIKEIKPAFNSIILIELENGEKLTVSRQYAKNLKEKLNF